VAPLVFFNHRGVCVLLLTAVPVHTASTTMFPEVVPVTVTLGAVLEPNAVTAVPTPLAPVNDTDPAVIVDAVDTVNATVDAPVAGPTKENNCT